MGAERVRERDALRFAARQCARETVEGQVAQPHVAHEREARVELGEDMHRHGAAERGELETADPLVDCPRGEACDLGDRAITHAHRQGFRLQAGSTTPGTGFRELVLPEENANVLLVPFCLEALEEGKHAQKPAGRSVQQEIVGRGTQVVPRGVERNVLRARGLTQDPAASLIPGFGPGVEGALDQTLSGVGRDERLVVLEHGAEAITHGAGAARVIE